MLLPAFACSSTAYRDLVHQAEEAKEKAHADALIDVTLELSEIHQAEHGKIQLIVKQNLLALQDQHAVGNRFVCYQ